MKPGNVLSALFLTCAAASAFAADSCCTYGDAGRMTGGGSIICTGPAYRYTFGYEVHCAREGQPISGPDANKPNAPFDTFYGAGSGTFNCAPAWIWFNLLDKGEPGAGVDIAAFAIQTASGEVLRCSNTLEGGNNQVHRATGNKP